MNREFLILTIVLIFSNSQSTLSQSALVEVAGRLRSVQEGKIFLIPYDIDPKYYHKKTSSLGSAKILNGRFLIKRKNVPFGVYPFRFYIESKIKAGQTGTVFLESKNQVVFIDTIEEYTSPIVYYSNIQEEVRQEFSVYFKDIVKEGKLLNSYEDTLYLKHGDSIPDYEENDFIFKCNMLVKKGDSVLMEYSKKHRNSFVSLWKLIERFSNHGYKSEYLNAFNRLSEKIKGTSYGKYFVKEILLAKKLSIGEKFPNLCLYDSSLIRKTFIPQSPKNKYTLIDFWFSECTPCLRQFKKYKILYDLFNDSGFDIVCISVDKFEKVGKWKMTILDENLFWKHFLDPGGIKSQSMLIKSYPTNFLVDEKGKIVNRNITSEELEKYLKENLFQ